MTRGTSTGLRWRLSTQPFLQVVWLLPLCFAIHEAEEWNILQWYREHWTNVGDLTNRTVWTHLVFVSALGFVVTGTVAALRRPRVAAILLLLYFGDSFAHSLLHMYWIPYFCAYSPGAATAVFLLVPAYVLVALRAVRDGLVPLWGVALIVGLSLYMVAFGISLGDTLPDGGLPW